MITKFESYNESRLFKKDNDNDIKELFDGIKQNFDISKLKHDRYYEYYEYEHAFDKFVRIIRGVGIIGHDYKLQIKRGAYGFQDIKDVSEYILRDLYKFFDKIYKDSEKIEQKLVTKELITGNKETSLPSLPKEKTKSKLSNLKKFLD